MSCVTALLFIFLVILIISIVGGCCHYSKDIDRFTDNMYNEWKLKLDEMKFNHNIGEPNGILKYKKESQECNTEQNLLIQSNVAFRPNRYGEQGCTYINKNYPIS